MRTFTQKQNPNQQTKPINSTTHVQAFVGQNHKVQRLLQSNAEDFVVGSSSTSSVQFMYDFNQAPVQAASNQSKLTISTPGERYEREADLFAEQVMRMPEPQVQHTCAPDKEYSKCNNTQGNHVQLQTRHVGSSDGIQREGPTIVHEALATRGQPLDSKTRRFMDPRLGHDFSRVRIHDDANAAAAAHAINARAFTLGQDIGFAPGYYAPHSTAGRILLAHELTHVIQNPGKLCRYPQGRVPSNPLAMRKPEPWDQLPAAVRRIFQASFTMRTDKEWIWNKSSAEKSYNSWPTRHRNAFNQVYTELVATGLWSEVRRLTSVFVDTGGAVPGIKFWPGNPAALVALLLGKSFCRDSQMYNVASRIVSSGSAGPKWRQMVPAGTVGLHVIPGIETEVHIDAISPVAKRAKNGDCQYAMSHILPHVSRDLEKGLRQHHITLFPTRHLKPGERPRPGEVQPWLQWRFRMQQQGMTATAIDRELKRIKKEREKNNK